MSAVLHDYERVSVYGVDAPVREELLRLERFEEFRLSPGRPEPSHRPSVLLHGLAELHIGFARRSA